MRAETTTALFLLALGAQAATVHLCGDSTMARDNGGIIQGWGEYLQYSLDQQNAVVVNHAIGGRSARSYTREGRFDEVAAQVENGDWVVIEFGHNDGGSPNDNDNGRSDCPGEGEETCEVVYDGASETVHTFTWYMKQGAQQMLDKGATVILSEQTPNNVWESGSFSYAPYRFYYLAWLAAEQLGGSSAGVYFLPHGQYTAQAWEALGGDTVNDGFPQDHTHTSPYLADVVAQSFALGLKCGTTALGESVVNSTSELTSSFLGPCLTGWNETMTDLLR